MVSFPIRGNAYRQPGERKRYARLENGESLTLEAEPQNPYDPNAVKVLSKEGVHLGYMPRDMAAQWHDKLAMLQQVRTRAKETETGEWEIWVEALAEEKQWMELERRLFSLAERNKYIQGDEDVARAFSMQKKDPEKALEAWRVCVALHPEDLYLHLHYLLALHATLRTEETEILEREMEDRFSLTEWPLWREFISYRKRRSGMSCQGQENTTRQGPCNE